MTAKCPKCGGRVLLREISKAKPNGRAFCPSCGYLAVEVEVTPKRARETVNVTLNTDSRSGQMRRRVGPKFSRQRDPIGCLEPCPTHHAGPFELPYVCTATFPYGTDRGDGKPVEKRSPTGDNIFPKHLHLHRENASEKGAMIGAAIHRWDGDRGHSFSLERIGTDGSTDLSEDLFDRLTSGSRGTRVMAEGKKAPSKAAPKGAAKKPTAPKGKPAKAKAAKPAKAAGGPRRQSRWSPETVAKVRKLHKEGKSIAEISKATKVPQGTCGGMIYRYARYEGARPGATN